MSVTIQSVSPPAGRAGSAPLTAFVFAGGSSLAAMQAGMLQALYERAITADLLVGTSAGALNAAYVASRPQTVATARELAAVWRGLRREQIFPINPRAVLGGLTNHSDHLIPDTGLRKLARRHFEIDRVEDAAVPLHLITVDLLAREEIRLSEGSALQAVLAAAAIPGVLPPVRHDGRILVAGGVVNNTPTSHAVALGAERIFTLESHDPLDRGLAAAPRGALDAAVHGVSLVIGSRARTDFDQSHSPAELLPLPALNPEHVQATDFEQAEQLLRYGLLSARCVLDGLSALGDGRRHQVGQLI